MRVGRDGWQLLVRSVVEGSVGQKGKKVKGEFVGLEGGFLVRAEGGGETDGTGTDDKDFDFGFGCLGDHDV